MPNLVDWFICQLRPLCRCQPADEDKFTVSLGVEHDSLALIGVDLGRVPGNITVCDQHGVRFIRRWRGKASLSAFGNRVAPTKVRGHAQIHDVGGSFDAPKIHQFRSFNRTTIGTRENSANWDLKRPHCSAYRTRATPTLVRELPYPRGIAACPVTSFADVVALRPVSRSVAKVNVIPTRTQFLHERFAREYADLLRLDRAYDRQQRDKQCENKSAVHTKTRSKTV